MTLAMVYDTVRRDTDLICVLSLRETWREVTFIHFLKCDVIEHIIPGSSLQCLIFVAT